MNPGTHGLQQYGRESRKALRKRNKANSVTVKKLLPG